jgi:outer membrane scaffolding protein for murein synthesis (MipA/OmpV family)
MRSPLVAAALAMIALPGMAHAQAAAAPEPPSALDGDFITIGAGVIYGPSYDGSDDYVATPVPVVQGRVAGVDITPRPGGVALDLLPDPKGAKVGFSAGPVATFSGNRNNQVEDRVVLAAGKLKSTIELGGNAGVTVYRVLHPYDSVTLSADVKWDINGAHSGMSVTPQIGYFTPLSRAAFVNIGASAKFVDNSQADYYFSVNPDQAAATGLPGFSADGGLTKVGATFLGGYDLNGDLLDGGFVVILIGSYSRMTGDASRTPWTSIRGDADQWMGGIGLGYTF